MQKIKHKKAVIIENKGQERIFRSMCKLNQIYTSPINKNMLYPHYEMLIDTGMGIYAFPNVELEGTDFSVLELGYVPVTLKQFIDSCEVSR